MDVTLGGVLTAVKAVGALRSVLLSQGRDILSGIGDNQLAGARLALERQDLPAAAANLYSAITAFEAHLDSYWRRLRDMDREGSYVKLIVTHQLMAATQVTLGKPQEVPFYRGRTVRYFPGYREAYLADWGRGTAGAQGWDAEERFEEIKQAILENYRALELTR